MRSSIAVRPFGQLSRFISILCAVTLCCGLIPSAAFAASDDSLSLIPEGGQGAVPIVSGAEGGSDDAVSHYASNEPLFVDGDGAASSSENVIDIDGGQASPTEDPVFINQDVELTTVIAQAESTKSFFLAQTLESTHTVPVVSAKLPLDTGAAEEVAASAEGEENADESNPIAGIIAAESVVVGSFAQQGITYAVESGGESVAVVAVDYANLPKEAIEEQTIALPSAVSLNEVDYYSVARIADDAFASFAREDLPSDEAADDEENVTAIDITTIIIPASVAQIEENAFTGFDTLQCIIVAEDNPLYFSYDGCLYARESLDLICAPNGVEHLALPEDYVMPELLSAEESSVDAFSTANSYAGAVAGTVRFVLNGGYMSLRDAASAAALDSVRYGDRTESFSGTWTIHVNGAFDWTRPTDDKRVRFMPLRDDYEFAGWSGYALGTAYAERTGSVTLTALWNPILKITTNGGTMTLRETPSATILNNSVGNNQTVFLRGTTTDIHVNGQVDFNRPADSKRLYYTVPTRTNYTFGGWEGYALGTVHHITASATLNAIWRSNVTFVLNGGKMRLFSTSNVALDSKDYGDMTVVSLDDTWTIHGDGKVDITRASDGVRVRYVPSREGYQFGGWEGYALGSAVLPKGPATLKAIWYPKVTFDVNGGKLWERNPSTGVVIGGPVMESGTKTFSAKTWGMHADGAVDFVTPDNVTHRYVALRDGYEFGGWVGYPLGSVHAIPAGATLKAIWNPKLTFVLNGGTMRLQDAIANTYLDEVAYGNQSIAYLRDYTTDIHANGNVDFNRASDGKRVRFIPSQAGYTFGGWNGYPLGSSHSITDSNVTLTATWRPVVNFELDGGYLRLCNASTGVPYDNVEYTGPAYCMGSNWTLHVNGAFDWNRTSDDKRVRYIPVKPGYVFTGWEGYPLGTAYVEWKPETLKATWNVLDYSITYHLDGGQNSLMNPDGYRVDMPTITLHDPARPGFVFQGWYTTADFAEGTRITEIASGSTGNLNLYAKWQETSYVIAFDAVGEGDGGSAGDSTVAPIESIPANYTDVIEVLPTPLARSSEGLVFMGWQAGDGVLAAGASVSPEMLMAEPYNMIPDETGTLTLVARWTAIINVTVPTDVTIAVDRVTGEVQAASAEVRTYTDYSALGGTLKIAGFALEKDDSAAQVFVDEDGVPHTSEVVLTLSSEENAAPLVRLAIDGDEAIDGDPLNPWGLTLAALSEASSEGIYAALPLHYGIDYGALDYSKFKSMEDDEKLPIATLYYTIAFMKNAPAETE